MPSRFGARLSPAEPRPGREAQGPAMARSDPIAETLDAFGLGAMFAAIELIIIFQTVAYNARATMFACRRQLPDGAFEAVKGVCFAIHHDLKGLVVVVAARFADRHDITSGLINRLRN
jgi:hypothetical protein